MKIQYRGVLALVIFHLLAAFSAAVKVGDRIPANVDLHFGFPPEKVNLSQRIANKKVIIVPGYLANEDALKQIGIDEVIIFCVNDGAVMQAWAQDQKVPDDSIIKLMGDPHSDLTNQLGMNLSHDGPVSVGLVNRCKRHALYVVDGEIKILRVAEKEDDPAGDAFPDTTLAEAMIDAIKTLGNDEL